MKILISGASGLIGSHLLKFLTSDGYEISQLVRDPERITEKHILWDPHHKALDSGSLERFRAIIHLSGENLSHRLWSKKQKERIKNSRVESTRFLARSINSLPDPKPVLLCASATGYYGDRGNESLTEASPAGSGFLAEVAQEWEDAASIARQSGARVVSLRFGVILSRQGGVLNRLLPIFKLGLGGKLGSGSQYMPWISLADVGAIIKFCLEKEEIEGPVNVVAPETVTNSQFTDTLADILSRPAFLKVPAGLLKIFLGEMAEQLFFNSARVEANVLLTRGYNFRYPQLKTALTSILS